MSFKEMSPDPPRNLYDILGVRGSRAECEKLGHAQLRQFYIEAARHAHPDAGGEKSSFDVVSRAWEILGDRDLRRLYDAAGLEAVQAVQSINDRAEAIKVAFPDGVDGEQMDFLSETGQLAVGLLSAPVDNSGLEDFGDADTFDPKSVDHDDACPRSVEEAIWNITSHPDRSVRYYGLWWIYKFKVAAAEEALLQVLESSDDQTALGGFGLRRRAALALGAVAPLSKKVLLPLARALQSTDYYLRYRAAEAIANIALRSQRQNTVTQPSRDSLVTPNNTNAFPRSVLEAIIAILLKGASQIVEDKKTKSGFTKQESLFDFEHLDPEVAEKLRKVFEQRRTNEDRSRRTTMTPQLGVDAVNTVKDEPYEWLLKALGAGIALQSPTRPSAADPGSSDASENGHQALGGDLVRDVIEPFLSHPFPLVRYAARKALFILTERDEHALALVSALDYGVEHHYSQRVLIRDLGDLGYAPASSAIAKCPMVENSFKILALKSILAKRDHDPSNSDVRVVLSHMDSLL